TCMRAAAWKLRLISGGAGVQDQRYRPSEGPALGDERAEEGVLAFQSDRVEIADDGPVGLPQAGLGVGDSFVGAVGRHQRLGLAEMGAGRGGGRGGWVLVAPSSAP